MSANLIFPWLLSTKPVNSIISWFLLRLEEDVIEMKFGELRHEYLKIFMIVHPYKSPRREIELHKQAFKTLARSFELAEEYVVVKQRIGSVEWNDIFIPQIPLGFSIEDS